VQFQKISLLPHRRDWHFLGGGGSCKTQKFKEMYEAQLEFPEGWGGLEKMDIFWSYTIHDKHLCQYLSYATQKQL